MRIILISTPIGFLGSGKGGGVELTLNSLVSGLLSLGHAVEVIAPKDSQLNENNEKAYISYNKKTDMYKVRGSYKINNENIRVGVIKIHIYLIFEISNINFLRRILSINKT